MAARSRVRERLAANDYDTFVGRLLNTQANAVDASGMGHVAQRIRTSVGDDRVLDARFAMGADSGAYLRTNVQALHTVKEGDKTSLADELMPEVELAGRAGLYSALEAHIKEQKHEKLELFESSLLFCGWMLSLPEIYVFCLEHLVAESSVPTPAPHAAAARAIVAQFDPSGGARADAVADSLARTGHPREVLCKIVDTLLLLFGDPMTAARSQHARALKETQNVSLAQLRLAKAARITRAVYDADRVPLWRAAPPAVIAGEAAAARFGPRLVVTPGASVEFPTLRFVQSVTATDVLMQALTAVMGLFTVSDTGLATLAPEVRVTLQGRLAGYAQSSPLELTAAFQGGHMEELLRVNLGMTNPDAWREALELIRLDHPALTSSIESYMIGATVPLTDELGRIVDGPATEVPFEEMLKIEELRIGRIANAAARPAPSLFASSADLVTLDSVNALILERGVSNNATEVVRVFSDTLKLNSRDANLVMELFDMQTFASPEAIAAFTGVLRERGITNAGPAITLVAQAAGMSEFRARNAIQRVRKDLIEQGEPDPYNFADLASDTPPEPVELPTSPEPERGSNSWKSAGKGAGVVEGAGAALIIAYWLRAWARRRPRAGRIQLRRAAARGGGSAAGNGSGQAAPPAPAPTPAARPGPAVPRDDLPASVPAEEESDDDDDDDSEDDDPAPAGLEDAGDGFCTAPNTAPDGDVFGGLCAAFSQMRADGGPELSAGEVVRREPGVSSTWDPHFRANQRSGDGVDWWKATVWPDGLRPAAPTAAVLMQNVRSDAGINNSGTFAEAGRVPATPEQQAVAFCLNRGLCAHRAPHHELPDGATRLLYTLPRVAFVNEAFDDLPVPEQPHLQVRQGSLEARANTRVAQMQKTAFCRMKTDVVTDIVRDDHDYRPMKENKIEAARVCAWVPTTYTDVTNEEDGSQAPQQTLDVNPDTAAVANAVAYEFLVDFYKRRAGSVKGDDATANVKRRLLLACAAATKILQLPSITATMHAAERFRGNNELLVDALRFTPDPGRFSFFLTRPVLWCGNGDVLYPCDAGVACYSVDIAPDAAELAASEAAAQAAAANQVATAAAYVTRGSPGTFGGRARITINRATQGMRKAIGQIDGRNAPMYVAMPPGTSGAPLRDEQLRERTLRGWSREVLAPDPEALSSRNILAALSRANSLCSELAQLDAELDHIKRLREDDAAERDRSCEADSRDELARLRRIAVWNDSLREASISGDRLWGFVRQLSGTISESVDSICQIDEGQLIAQQRETIQRRQRAGEQASREHMNLVRNVFTSILRQGGLTLGIGTEGADLGQFKVVSSTLRKQASELTSRSSGDGFFTNAVQLEQLLSKGTGEISLTDLFDQLRKAGVELQQAALSANNSLDSIPDLGGSLEFLSAPRNSLVLRYKPEALAAMRHGYDIFQEEIRRNHWHMMRPISAYELIEGRSEELSSAFAAYCAHLLAHARIFSSSLAPYVGTQPARANAMQLQISLQRLVRAACDYVMQGNSPAFTVPGGRERYFMQNT